MNREPTNNGNVVRVNSNGYFGETNRLLSLGTAEVFNLFFADSGNLSGI